MVATKQQMVATEAILRHYGTTNCCLEDTLRRLEARLRCLGAILRRVGDIKTQID